MRFTFFFSWLVFIFQRPSFNFVVRSRSPAQQFCLCRANQAALERQFVSLPGHSNYNIFIVTRPKRTSGLGLIWLVSSVDRGQKGLLWSSRIHGGPNLLTFWEHKVCATGFEKIICMSTFFQVAKSELRARTIFVRTFEQFLKRV